MLTLRDIAILTSVAKYTTLTRQQINALHFPEDTTGRVTRRRLQVLVDIHMIRRTQMQVVNPAMGSPAPVYYPTPEGCAFLAQEHKDVRFLGMPTQTPNWQHLYHWTQVAEVHIRFDRAVENHGSVTVEEWLSEWSVVNPHETDPEKRYRLYTLLRTEPRLVCVPDAAFLLAKDGYRKAYYVEVDRDTTKDARRVAASKSEGYAVLAERGLHKRHFPATNIDPLTVLCIAPTPRRRDALAKAMKEKRGAELWRFAALDDLATETFITAPVFYSCDGAPAPILKSSVSVAPPVASIVQEAAS